MFTFGLVGFGYWGPNMARNLSKHHMCRLKYICELSSERRESAQKQYQTTQCIESYQQLLDDPEVDAVVIATPTHTHFELAKKAIVAKKNCLIEKPMTQTLVESNELIRLAEKNNVKLGTDHTFLFTDSVDWIKKFMKSPEFGEPLYFNSERLNLGLIQKDINVIWDLAPHDISILLHLFDDFPKSVFATGTKHFNNTQEELAHITLEFPRGKVAHINASWISPIKVRNIVIGGDKKMLVFDDTQPTEKIRVYDRSVEVDLADETAFNPVYRVGDITIPCIGNNEAIKVEIDNFIGALSKKQTLLSDGKLGCDVVRILEATDRSLKNHSKVEI